MIVDRRWCGACDRNQLVRVLCGEELVDLIGAAADGPSIPGTWTVQVTLCPHCRSLVYSAALVTAPPPELSALYPPIGGSKR